MSIEFQSAVHQVPGAGGRLSAHVYETIKTRLLEGEYPAGSKLSVEYIRTEFGVSKQPVMEALRLLSSDGLVEIFPQIGCVVASYSQPEVADFFRMFSAFEGAIAGVSAGRSTLGALEELDSISLKIVQLADNPDAAARARHYRLLNRRFHETIHEMGSSRIIANAGRRMWDLSDFLVSTAGPPQPMAGVIIERQEDHDRIREALARGDAATARKEMEEHVLSCIWLLQVEEATA